MPLIGAEFSIFVLVFISLTNGGMPLIIPIRHIVSELSAISLGAISSKN